MKKQYLPIHFNFAALSAVCLFIMLFVSCQDKVEITREYTIYEPVFLSMADLRDGFEVSEPQVIDERGKIYLYKKWILINDPGKGIHIVDNSNPESPQATSYLTLPGNFGFSIRNDFLYADSYIDLVVLDVKDMNNIQETSRLEGLLSDFSNDFTIDEEKGLIVDYAPVRKIDVSLEQVNGHFNHFYDDAVFLGAELRSFASMDAAAIPASHTGIGGSMATFTIVDHFLYILDNRNLHTINILDPDAPSKTADLSLGWGIETIFPYGENLFVGAENGMYIIDNTSRNNPELITMYSHVVSCDPVVVQGDRAYVTLRAGSNCRGNFNQLEVIDISDLANPLQVAVYPMSQPHGLGIDGDILFVCEGEQGFRVFDASNDSTITQNVLFSATNLDAYDVIPYNNTLFLIGKDGIYQYDYSDPDNLSLISKLQITDSGEL